MTSVVVIISAANRRGVKRVVDVLHTQLAGRVDLQTHVVATSSAATGAARDAAATADTVVAVGGDGTVADVATGIFGSNAKLGIIPTGSTNITARSLGIPTDPVAAAAAFGGPILVRCIDVGRSGDRVFLHIAGAGLDAEMFKATDPVWKRRVGWMAYLPAAAAALRLSPSDLVVTADGERIEASSPLVLIANGGSAITPSFEIYPGIAIDDGWLDLLVFTATTPAAVAAALGHLTRQRLDRSPHVIWRRVASVRVDADPPLAVQLDGDPRGTTPRDFEVVARGLEVVIPAD